MLKIHQVSKIYQRKYLLEDLNLEVANGEIFGVIGAHGAGKTTLCRMVAGLIPFEGGEILAGTPEVRIDGEGAAGLVGYVPAEFGRYRDMTVAEYLEYYGGLYGISGYRIDRRMQELLPAYRMDGLEVVPVAELAPHEKKQLALVRCMLREPDVLVLDDFYHGIDAGKRPVLDELLHLLQDTGKAILVTSAGFSPLAGSGAFLGILQNGAIAVQGSLEEISEQINQTNPLELLVAENCAGAVEVLKQEETVTRISIDGGRILAGFRGTQEDQTRILRRLVENDVELISFQRRKSDLETAFWKMTEEN